MGSDASIPKVEAAQVETAVANYRMVISYTVETISRKSTFSPS